jgi:pyruvate dehydrogenase E2 component (dihydrolipoamide acetyltransferase)
MAEIVRMLALSPTMEEGLLVRWTKAEGESIEEGEIIAEVETDKAAMEMESFFDGTVIKLLVQPGSGVRVGEAMAIIGEPGEDISGLLEEPTSAPATEGPAPEAVAPAAAVAAPPAPIAQTPVTTDRVFSSPVARKIAAEHGLDVASIAGSGPSGRVVKRDVEDAVASGVARRSAALTPAPADARVSLTPMRKAIARRMTESWTTAPLFALQMEIDMGPAMAMRKELNAALAASDTGMKVSVNDMIIKACALALREVPTMNVGWGGDHIVQFGGVHIGVAVAIEGGLITPVVRDADRISLTAISTAVKDLATRARAKKLAPEEYSGSTFSISNLGMYGISRFQAIINPPEAGILAAGAVQKRPIVQDGEVVPGTRMDVTLSVDHRSADGAIGAEFLQALKRLLERPLLLMAFG